MVISQITSAVDRVVIDKLLTRTLLAVHSGKAANRISLINTNDSSPELGAEQANELVTSFWYPAILCADIKLDAFFHLERIGYHLSKWPVRSAPHLDRPSSFWIAVWYWICYIKGDVSSSSFADSTILFDSLGSDPLMFPSSWPQDGPCDSSYHCE